MDLFGIVAAIVRRWYVSLPILLIAGFLAQQAYKAVEPAYTASVTVVVLPSLAESSGAPPPPEGVPVPVNPYNGSGGARFAAAVLARNINSTSYAQNIGLPVGSGTFMADAAREQPIIRIDATASSPGAVTDLLEKVSAGAATVLNDFQAAAGAPEDKRYRAAPAVPVGNVEDITPSRMRSAGAIGVLGLAVAAATAVAADVALLRRRSRSATGGEPPNLVEATATSPGDRPQVADGARNARSGGGRQPDGAARLHWERESASLEH
ncbi:hypothetical protein ACFSBG_00895 [Georgenia yuyongxinii]|uniref:hypothetical protein n=1 Tax=Georgenia yuyongxinii TaxID=2589797 RepID=UPI00143D90A3|nr:hypothetical protein [Georgenia yuyongxinii]